MDLLDLRETQPKLPDDISPAEVERRFQAHKAYLRHLRLRLIQQGEA